MTESDQSGEAYGQYDDEGILPDDIDRPLGVNAHGTTWAEEEHGATLEDRVNAEVPEEPFDSPDDGDRGAESNAVNEV